MELVIKCGRKELRQFGWMMGLVLVGVFGTLLPLLFGKPLSMSLIYIGLGFALVGGLVPRVLKPIYIAWMHLGAVLGWVNSRIILGALFYLMFVPIGLMMRLFGRDALSRRIEKNLPSYRVTSYGQKDVAKQMERPF